MFGWFALVPLFVALFAQRTLRGFLLALTAGVCYFSGTLYWITNVMANYGDMPFAAAAGINALLILYQSAYLAVFGALFARVSRIGGERLLLAAPLLWVAFEYARAHFLSGFPWVLLGYSQAPVLPIAQLASIVGVFGLSLLVAAINASIAYALIASGRRSARPFIPFAAMTAVVVVVALWGSLRIGRGVLLTQGAAVRVGLIQGNVAQEDKVDDRRSRGIYAAYLQMTRQAIFQGAQFVVWPESSTPFMFEDDRAAAEELRRIAREARVAVLLGTDQVERSQPPKYYNGAVMVDADGNTAATYQKMHLVPFGEYVPARQLFFFVPRIVDAISDFSSGVEPRLLPVGEHRVNTSICYEVVYPDLVRRFVNDGSELLTTITNDAWFGPTSAPYQHFAQASMRAIENGRFLVRAANTGISGIVDPYGRTVAASGLFEPAVIVGNARFLQTVTPYMRIGDAVAYASILSAAALLILVRRRVQ